MSQDRTQAEALRLAKADLERRGWSYAATDIGKLAREIMDAMREETPQETGE